MKFKTTKIENADVRLPVKRSEENVGNEGIDLGGPGFAFSNQNMEFAREPFCERDTPDNAAAFIDGKNPVRHESDSGPKGDEVDDQVEAFQFHVRFDAPRVREQPTVERSPGIAVAADGKPACVRELGASGVQREARWSVQFEVRWHNQGEITWNRRAISSSRGQERPGCTIPISRFPSRSSEMIEALLPCETVDATSACCR